MKNKKRILYVHHGSGIGGAPLSLLYLIEKLDREKYDPLILCISEGPHVDLFRENGINVIIDESLTFFEHSEVGWHEISGFYATIWETINLIPTYFKAKKILKEILPDIIHLSTSCLFIFAKAAKALKKDIKVVSHIREPIAEGYLGIRKKFVQKMNHKYVDVFIPIDNYSASTLIQKDTCIKVINNFVDFNKFDRNIESSILREQYNLSNDDKIVILLGGVNLKKGTLEFIKAAKIILKNRDDYYYFIIGYYPPKMKINSIIDVMKPFIKKILGLDYWKKVLKETDNMTNKNIIFTGVRMDIPKCIASSNLLVFPSTVPHFGRPIIEASAMGKPVIGSNLGGPNELIEDGKTGLLVQSKNPKALADAIQKICENPELARKMGALGYKLAKERFDADKNAKATFEVYEELLKSNIILPASLENISNYFCHLGGF